MAKKLTIEQVREIIDQNNETLISNEYINAFQKLSIKCNKGHVRNITFSNFRKGQKCFKCHSHNRFSIEEVRKIFEKENYLVISDTYTGSRNKISVKCSKGHLWSVSLNKFKNRNQRCPNCSFLGGYSRMEKDLFDIIKSYYPSTKKTKIRNIKIKGKPHIKGFDIDIFIPELNMGIEFDGSYYHSINGLKRSYPKWPLQDIKKYHTIKDKYFKSFGIEILHISEKEWIKDKDKCVLRCLNFLRKSN